MDQWTKPIYGEFRNRKFTDIYPDVDAWLKDLKEYPIKIDMEDSTLMTLYYLLYARYGNSTIAANDEMRFKANVSLIIFSYGPTWEKRLEIQSKLRHLSEDDIRKGAKMVYNHAFNPSTEPSTATLEELTTIDQQNTNNSVRGKLEGYQVLAQLLETDVTSYMLDRFQKLFLVIVMPEEPLLYED